MPLLAPIKKLLDRSGASGRRVVTPTVLQMEAVECGAASLAIILGYFGRIVPLEELRLACGVSRDGTNARNLLQAGRAYGLKGKGFRKTIERLREMAFPVIIFWNMNHFLVLEGFKKDRFYLSDPAYGRYTVTAEEFDESFTGVVLAFEPGPDFKKAKAKHTLLSALSSRLVHSKRTVLFITLISALLVIPGLLIPTFTRVFIDQFLINSMHRWIPPLLLVMFLVMALNTALVWVQQHYLLRLENKLAVSTSGQFLWHILHLPIAFFTQRFGGEIGARVDINNRVARLLSGELATTMFSVLTVVFYLVLMVQYDAVLTLISLFIAGLNVLALRFVSRKRVDGNRRILQETGKLVSTTMGGVQMIETLKATGGEADFFNRWYGYFAKVINGQQELGLYTRAVGVVPPLLTALNTTAILAVGSYRVMTGALTIGMLIAFKYLMDSFMAPVNRLVQIGSLLQETEGDMNRLDDVLRYRQAPDVQINGALPTPSVNGTVKLAGRLELRNVTFAYNPPGMGPPLIEDFSMRLTPGSRVALVGGSGSGKSTIARLVCGLYEPWSGEILFDNRPRHTIPRSVLNNSLALVDQEIMLFAGTIRDNLSLWDATIPEAHVVQAARDAHIHEIIAARKGGYESLIREGGNNFSGGQRQRLEIARALALTPSLLVLDEGTSALDPVSEKVVMDNLRRRGCTCLIVAHRLSTIRDCDEIIVLEYGKVVQRGRHEELIHAAGHYADLVAAG